MKRYCTNCKKEYEFEPVKVTGGEALICPECGAAIDKNSRHPVDYAATARFEQQIGDFFAHLMGIAYIFYITLAIIGIVGYFINNDKMLYISTAISLGAFILQLLTKSSTFRWGLLLLPLGGIAGWFFMGDIKGACFGVHAVFFIRHVLRDILFAIVRWLISLGNKK